MSHHVCRAVALPGRAGGAFDLTLADGRVAAIDPVAGPPVALALPPLVDLHLHACRAFTLGDTLPRDFDDSVAMATALAARFTVADYRRQADRLFEAVVAQGTARVRTHADIGHAFGLAALEGTLAAASDRGGQLAVETVAFLSGFEDPLDASAADLLETAHRMGATLIGAVPNFYPDPARSIDALLDIADRLGCGVDVHLDEHLDRTGVLSGILADAAARRGIGDRVTLSHGCAMTTLDREAQRRLADALARAGITVIALPTTNLYLQDRGAGTPIRRGITILHELTQAGVAVRLASDNVRDCFYPYGSGDLIDIARIAVLAGHVERPDMLLPMICDGRASLSVGDPADLVLVEAPSLVEALATPGIGRRRVTQID